MPRLQSALRWGPANGEWITIGATFRARLAGTLALQADQLMEGGCRPVVQQHESGSVPGRADDP